MKNIQLPINGHQDIMDTSLMFAKAIRTADKKHKAVFRYIWRYGIQIAEFHINSRYRSFSIKT